MKSHLGGFEELVLLIIAVLDDEAYGLAICDKIKEQTGRSASIGAVHATVSRLEDKGLVQTTMGGSSNKRGGRRKRMIELTQSGRKALHETQALRANLWDQIPNLQLEG